MSLILSPSSISTHLPHCWLFCVLVMKGLFQLWPGRPSIVNTPRPITIQTTLAFNIA
ncbi:hypothetical protein BD777DRAFT_126154 [Yarrowia lipolytica]|nr:hypothetical protein BD777DRAFT_126154 [Yarrowia lipolytica]